MSDSPDLPSPSGATSGVEGGLLDEVFFAGAVGGYKRKGKEPLVLEFDRSLTAEDVEELGEMDNKPAGVVPQLSHISYAHHRVAHLLAEGREVQEVALLTGYSPATIYAYKTQDPAFKELLAYYMEIRREVFVDTLERMKILGVMAMEELQRRLSDDPAGWSKRELLEMHKQMISDPLAAAQKNTGLGGAGPSIGISVSFVQAALPAEGGPLLDALPTSTPINSEN